MKKPKAYQQVPNANRKAMTALGRQSLARQTPADKKKTDQPCQVKGQRSKTQKM
jgi:hypothetical protein